MREYNIDYNDPEEAARTTLQMHIDTLISCRGKTPHPIEMEWEIRLYEFMQKDPATRLKQYHDTRFDNGNDMVLSKRAVAKKLGWEVQ